VCSFFFSSRRRHTRFSRDWSSDVCSSDLAAFAAAAAGPDPAGESVVIGARLAAEIAAVAERYPEIDLDPLDIAAYLGARSCPEEIGRASCRERVSISAGGRACTKETISTS